MQLAGSVALVVGADSAVGAAIARRLIARGAVKVYPAPKDMPRELSKGFGDVMLLVNCLVAVQQGASALAGLDIQPLGRESSPAGRTRQLIDAFAPVLAARGGGAVVNLLSVLCADPPLDDATSAVSQSSVDWALSDGLRGRLAAQQTRLLYLRAQLAVGIGERTHMDECALADFLAARVLDQLEASGRSNNDSTWFHENMPSVFRAGGRRPNEHSD